MDAVAPAVGIRRRLRVPGVARVCVLKPRRLLLHPGHWVAFGVCALELGFVSHVHTSSGVQVHGHEAEQVFGAVAQEL